MNIIGNLFFKLVKIIKNDKLKIKLIDRFKDEYHKKELINSIEQEQLRVELLNEIEDNEKYNSIKGEGEEDVENAKCIKDIQIKLKALEKFKKEDEILSIAISIAGSIDDDIVLINLLNKLKDVCYQKKYILAIRNENLRFYALNESNVYGLDRIEILKTIKNDDVRKKCIKNLTSTQEATMLARYWGYSDFHEIDYQNMEVNRQDEEKQIEIFNKTEYKCIKIDIAKKFAKLEKKEALKGIFSTLVNELNNETILDIINLSAQNDKENFAEECMKDKVVFEKIIKAKRSYKDMAEIITQISTQTKINFFKAKIDIDGNKNILKSYLLDKDVSYEIILKELDMIMEIYGVETKDIPHKKEYLMQMYSTNNDVIKSLNYELLDNKYIEKLGLDKINLISCYSDIQEKILSLSDQELDVWIKCIDHCMNYFNTEDWTTIANSILDNLCAGEYKELINNVYEIENIDMNILSHILQGRNIFAIKSKEDIMNYKKIKKEKTDKLIRSDNLKDKKEATLQKIFGLDFSYALDVLNSYGQDIDLLPESDIKYYIKSLQEIIKCNSSSAIEKIYQECKEITFVDKAMTERSLKTEYGKLYNDGLLKIENLEKIGENMYSAGTDFKMIIHSVGACKSGPEHRYDKNYKKDWNRPFIKSQYISTSYIRNDMLGTAGRHRICYGFSEMEPDSLMEAGPGDIDSSTEGFESGALTKKFLAPDNMIDNTNNYNELSYRRNQKGKRLQPNYIVVFKYNGEIENLEEAKKTQKDWGGLPIVVVDVDECIKSERAKVDAMIEEYKINPNVRLAKQIRSKIRNNRQFRSNYGMRKITNFYKDIDIEKFIIEENHETNRKVIEKELEENDCLINNGQVGTMKKIFVNLMQRKQGDMEIG